MHYTDVTCIDKKEWLVFYKCLKPNVLTFCRICLDIKILISSDFVKRREDFKERSVRAVGGCGGKFKQFKKLCSYFTLCVFSLFLLQRRHNREFMSPKFTQCFFWNCFAFSPWRLHLFYLSSLWLVFLSHSFDSCHLPYSTSFPVSSDVLHQLLCLAML